MEELIKKIDRAIEKKILNSGKMGSEVVSISLELTEEEKDIWKDVEKYDGGHYFWEIDGSTLYISYVEDV